MRPNSRKCLVAAALALLLSSAAIQPATVTAFSSSTRAYQYLSDAVLLANKLHDYMLNQSSGAFYYSVSDNWLSVTGDEYSTLGNAFIVGGLVQLYIATGNSTYLTWASHTANRFWDNAWDPINGGFYDTYLPSWKNNTCTQTTQNNAYFLVVFLNLYSANGSSIWLNRANDVESLLNSRFFDSVHNTVDVSANVCTKALSGDSQIEVSIGSYLWATSQWSEVTSSTAYLKRMTAIASFAWDYLWDTSSNTLPPGPDSTGCTSTGGASYLGFMRSVYSNLTGLEDCRKGANENIWGAVGLAYLYNLSGNSTLLNWVNQDLTWLNSTFWDSTVGGYHQDAYRNDTLRSACASDDDPKDYPGWTQGEQPWLWWTIGGLTSNSTMQKWALVPEAWTAQHQWNSTYGGDMTCLDSNAAEDPGSTSLFDWIQGSALTTFSTLYSTSTFPLSFESGSGSSKCGGSASCASSAKYAIDTVAVETDAPNCATGLASAGGLCVGDNTTFVFLQLNLLKNGFESTSISLGDQYEVDFSTGATNVALVLDGTGSSRANVSLYYYQGGFRDWDQGDSFAATLFSSSPVTSTSGRSEVEVVSSSATDDGAILFGVSKAYLQSPLSGSGTRLLDIIAYTYSGSTGCPGDLSGIPPGGCPTYSSLPGGTSSAKDYDPSSGTLSYTLSSGGIPEFPLGALLLVVPVLLIYFFAKSRMKLSGQSRPSNRADGGPAELAASLTNQC